MLTKPLLLLLEDPMAGLDIPSRGEVSRVLGELNAAGSMRVVLVLRGKGAESMPEWITDVCEVNSGDVWLGSKAEWSRRTAGLHQEATINDIKEDVASESNGADVEPVIRLQDVSVSYGEGTRQVRKIFLANV
jgi:ABC-type multidrug transport system ATPase subunit